MPTPPPLDSFDRCAPVLDAAARRFLSPAEWEQYARIPAPERQAQLRALLERPIARFTPVNEAYFRARWGGLLEQLHPQPGLRLLEIATGDADMIPQAMQRTHPAGSYTSANQNEKLNRSFRANTAGLDLDIRIIADDAAELPRYAAPGEFDLVAFQHALNDVVQAILCARAGIDTTQADWMETLPAMIALLQTEVAQGTLEQHAKDPFLALMRVLLDVLKSGGWVALNHYQFQLDLDWGYPPALWANFVPMVRTWLPELPGFREVTLDGFAPQWWIFLQKD